MCVCARTRVCVVSRVYTLDELPRCFPSTEFTYEAFLARKREHLHKVSRCETEPETIRSQVSFSNHTTMLFCWLFLFLIFFFFFLLLLSCFLGVKVIVVVISWETILPSDPRGSIKDSCLLVCLIFLPFCFTHLRLFHFLLQLFRFIFFFFPLLLYIFILVF